MSFWPPYSFCTAKIGLLLTMRRNKGLVWDLSAFSRRLCNQSPLTSLVFKKFRVFLIQRIVLDYCQNGKYAHLYNFHENCAIDLWYIQKAAALNIRKSGILWPVKFVCNLLHCKRFLCTCPENIIYYLLRMINAFVSGCNIH